VAGTTPFTIQPVRNYAPDGVGDAYLLGPEGSTFAAPVKITFRGLSAADVGRLQVASQQVDPQEALGYWVRAPAGDVVRDAAAGTISVAARHFSSWSLTDAPVRNAARDLAGSFTIVSTTDIPATATAGPPTPATLTFAGEDPAAVYYVLSGTVTLSTPVTWRGATCDVAAPETPALAIRENIAEARNATGTKPRQLWWGTSGHWNLSCGGAPTLLTMAFDTVGINYLGCTRPDAAAIATQVMGPDRLAGSYAIDCGGGRGVTASWDFLNAVCGQACGTSTNPCIPQTWDCSSGNRSCVTGAPLADGTPCGDGQTCNAGQCVSSGALSGTRVASWWPDAGAPIAAAPFDAATATVQALIPDGLGGWTVYPPPPAPPASLTSTGCPGSSPCFSIAGVPAGTRLVVLRDGSGVVHAVETAATALDLGYDLLGRANAVPASPPPSPGTPVTFDLSGLEAWAAGDELQIASSNADVWDVLVPRLPPKPAFDFGIGDVAGQAEEDWGAPNASAAPLNLLAASDLLYVHQLGARTDTSGVSYQAATAWASLTGTALTNGAAASLAPLVLSPTANPGITVSGAWSLSGFEAQGPLMNPSATTDANAHALVVSATPHLVTAPVLAPGPVPRGTPALLAAHLPAGAPEPTLGALTYGRFLDPLWNEWIGVAFTVHVSMTAAGASTALDEAVSVGWRQPTSVALPAAFAPVLTPVQGLTLTSSTGTAASAFGPRTGVGTTPSLSWMAPATGTPTSYLVEVLRLYANGARSAAAPVASFYTAGTATRVAIPPGVLAAGNVYYARVTARSTTPDPFATAPLRRMNIGAWASSLTGTFTP
jgi:hypothetical protein